LPFKKFFLCVDGFYVKNGKVLLVKRDIEPFKGYWGLVGGHVDEGETVKEALKREFLEETDLNIEIGEIIDVRLEETFDRVKIILTFEVLSAIGDIKINQESIEFGWFSRIPVNSVHNYEKFFLKNQTDLK
jgi:ADP-ribose pyrophosphatase YjhB (NUDIX family)